MLQKKWAKVGTGTLPLLILLTFSMYSTWGKKQPTWQNSLLPEDLTCYFFNQLESKPLLVPHTQGPLEKQLSNTVSLAFLCTFSLILGMWCKRVGFLTHCLTCRACTGMSCKGSLSSSLLFQKFSYHHSWTKTSLRNPVFLPSKRSCNRLSLLRLTEEKDPDGTIPTPETILNNLRDVKTHK